MLRKREFCVLHHLTLIVNIQDFVAGRGKRQGVELESKSSVLRLCWNLFVCCDYFGTATAELCVWNHSCKYLLSGFLKKKFAC